MMRALKLEQMFGIIHKMYVQRVWSDWRIYGTDFIV